MIVHGVQHSVMRAKAPVRLALLVGCGFLQLILPARAASGDRPNILIVMVDDLGKEWISAYGAEGIRTPQIDRLAASGMLFENFYCMPQCTPTRVTLLTGQYPFRHGWVNHWDVPRWGGGCSFDPQLNPSLPRLLQAAGYVTAAAGKWQIDDFRQEPDAMIAAGFDESLMWTGYEAGNPASDQRYWNPYVHASSRGDAAGHRPASRTVEGRFGPDLFAEFLIDFLSRHRDEPMFIYYPMVLTHPPWVHTPLEPDAGSSLEKHCAMVRYADHLTGRIVDQLQRLGLRDRTLILWTTDNGTSSPITGRLNGRAVRGGKAETLESGVCVPLIASWPSVVPANCRTQALVDMTDLLPTCADLAGVDLPEHYVFDGHSFGGALRNARAPSAREWIMAMGGRNDAQLSEVGVENKYWFRDRVLRDQRFKLYLTADRRIGKLIDLPSDPEEQVDVQARGEPEVQAALERLWKAAQSFPDHDNDPVYQPLPSRPWYRTPAVRSQLWKAGYPARKAPVP